MRYHEFVEAVGQRAGIEQQRAEAASRAMVQALAEQDYRRAAARGGGPTVGQHAQQIPRQAAMRDVQDVLRTLREHVPEREIADTQAQLPSELAELFD